jgi:type IV conjugative transfer system coupling protein TraD
MLMKLRNKTNRAKLFTRGGQLISHSVRMFGQINKTVFKWFCIGFFLCFCLGLYLFTPHETWTALFYLCYAKFAGVLEQIFPNYHARTFYMPFQGRMYFETIHSVFQPAVFLMARGIYGAMMKSTILSIVVGTSCSVSVARFFTKAGEKLSEDKLVHGARFYDVKTMRCYLRKKRNLSRFRVEKLPMSHNFEVYNTLMYGAVGTGKTQVFLQLMNQLRQSRRKNERAVVFDPDGTYVHAFFRPDKDILLNPFDERCANWDLWSEIDAYDITLENLCHGLISCVGANKIDPFFINNARLLFQAMVKKMQTDSNRSVDRLLHWVLLSSLTELHEFLKDTQAVTITDPDIDKTALSIRAELLQHVAGLRFLSGLKGDQLFSIDRWMREADNDSWLFIASQGKYRLPMKSLMTAWTTLTFTSLLSLPKNNEKEPSKKHRRIHFFFDELSKLHQLPNLAKVINEARKFGGCFYLGLQSDAQIKHIYGDKEGTDILNALKTQFFFQCSDANVAKYAERQLGEQEVQHCRENQSYGAKQDRDIMSISNTVEKRPLVKAGDLMALNPLNCFVRLNHTGGDASDDDLHLKVVPLTLKHRTYPEISPSLQLREIPINATLEKSIQAEKAKKQKKESTSQAANEDADNANEPKQREKTREPSSGATEQAKEEERSEKPAVEKVPAEGNQPMEKSNDTQQEKLREENTTQANIRTNKQRQLMG